MSSRTPHAFREVATRRAKQVLQAIVAQATRITLWAGITRAQPGGLIIGCQAPVIFPLLLGAWLGTLKS